MSLVNANVVLRYLLDDHEELSPRAAEILEQHTVTMPVEVGCEVVYVLQRVYAVPRKEIQQQLSGLLSEGWVHMDQPHVFLKALECYGDSTLDFVDALLWAYHVLERQEVFTFDSKLLNLIQRTETSR